MDQLDALKTRAAEYRGGLQSLADEAAVSKSWLSKFINGAIKNPTIGTIGRLSAALEKLAPPQ